MLLNKILRYFFYWPFRITTRCDTIPYEPLKQLNIDKNKIIVYVTVSSSLGNLMCIERAAKRMGLPSPFSDIKIFGTTMPRICYLRSPGFFTAKGTKYYDLSETFENGTTAINQQVEKYRFFLSVFCGQETLVMTS